MGQLEKYGATPTEERVVIQDKYVTAAGVSAGIDMALTLSGKIAGDTHAQVIQLALEYDPQPPYNAGSPTKAPTEITTHLKSHSRHTLQQPTTQEPRTKNQDMTV
jgi:transcriptional regulator GlxA family with amidase domain